MNQKEISPIIAIAVLLGLAVAGISICFFVINGLPVVAPQPFTPQAILPTPIAPAPVVVIDRTPKPPAPAPSTSYDSYQVHFTKNTKAPSLVYSDEQKNSMPVYKGNTKLSGGLWKGTTAPLISPDGQRFAFIDFTSTYITNNRSVSRASGFIIRDQAGNTLSAAPEFQMNETRLLYVPYLLGWSFDSKAPHHIVKNDLCSQENSSTSIDSPQCKVATEVPDYFNYFVIYDLKSGATTRYHVGEENTHYYQGWLDDQSILFIGDGGDTPYELNITTSKVSKSYRPLPNGIAPFTYP